MNRLIVFPSTRMDRPCRTKAFHAFQASMKIFMFFFFIRKLAESIAGGCCYQAENDGGLSIFLEFLKREPSKVWTTITCKKQTTNNRAELGSTRIKPDPCCF